MPLQLLLISIVWVGKGLRFSISLHICISQKVILALCSRKPRKGVRIHLFFGWMMKADAPEESEMDRALAAPETVYQEACGGSWSLGR